jgi:hypothetical protein
MCSPVITTSKNTVAVNGKSIRRIRPRASPVTVVEDVTLDDAISQNTEVEFQAKLNDITCIGIDQSENLKCAESRRRARRTRRSRPDARGRINGKECHIFAFTELFDE